MMAEHDRVVPTMERIHQIMDALLDHDRDRGAPIIEVIEQTIIEQNSIKIYSCPSLGKLHSMGLYVMTSLLDENSAPDFT